MTPGPRVLGGMLWPKKLGTQETRKYLNEIIETNEGSDFTKGVISPKEFDSEFAEMNDDEIQELMDNVLIHPMIIPYERTEDDDEETAEEIVDRLGNYRTNIIAIFSVTYIYIRLWLMK